MEGQSREFSVRELATGHDGGVVVRVDGYTQREEDQDMRRIHKC